MRKQIRTQMIKMIVVMLGIAWVTVFAWDFVYTGLKAKLVLNGGIWLVFLFGVAMAFVTVIRLRNEELAFTALTEAYEDIKEDRARAAKDPYWRHYRCLSPGTVFQRPRLLGHTFELVYEEMLRTKNLKVSVGTMQTLVHGIEEKLAEERSLVTYLSGLLVFLGLIGAFIGLIQMVSSVSGIVGSLGGASGPGVDTSAMFSRLIGQLQGPLSGMSVGFSSSLFGLAGSLALGLIGRFAAQAGTVLKTEFEGWLANVAQIEDNEGHDAAIPGVVDERTGKDVVAALTGVGRSVQASQKSTERVAEMMERLVALQAENTAALTRAAEEMARLREMQTDVRQHIAQSAVHTGALAAAKDEMVRSGRELNGQVAAGLGAITAALAGLQNGQEAGFRRLAERPQDVAVAAPGGAYAGSATLDAAAISEIRRVADGVEAGMAAGLGEVARSIETSFQAYADLLRLTQSRAVAEPAEEEAHGAPAASVVTPLVPPSEPPPAPDPVDHDAMARKLYDRIAQAFQATGTRG